MEVPKPGPLRLLETESWSLAATLEHYYIPTSCLKAQTRASSLDPLRTEDKTGLIPSSGSRCSCFDSNDRCLFIFLIILWLNNFISVVIKNVLMAHSYVGSIAGPGAVPGHVGVGKGPICTDDISYMYC